MTQLAPGLTRASDSVGSNMMDNALQILLRLAADWVRRVLDFALSRRTSADMAKKLEVIRLSAQSCYPTADIKDMLAEIERGYMGE